MCIRGHNWIFVDSLGFDDYHSGMARLSQVVVPVEIH